MTDHIPPREGAHETPDPSRDSPPAAPSSGAAPPLAAAPSPVPEIPFDPVPLRARRDGWTAAKQRGFIRALAETGIVRIAAASVGMSERSAHRLALRDDAESFCVAWDAALQIAARRGASLLFEYALEGVTETIWRDGEIVCQRRRPSERALFFLLTRLDPVRFARPPAPDPRFPDYDPLKAHLSDYELHLDSLHDLPDEEEEGEARETDGPFPDAGGREPDHG